MNHLDNRSNLRIGVLSDTHGHLDPTAGKLLAGVDAIIHAGDVGGPEIIDTLSQIAPVIAVRGNMDGGRWASDLPGLEIVRAGGLMLCVLHDGNMLDLDPLAAGIGVVIKKTGRALYQSGQCFCAPPRVCPFDRTSFNNRSTACGANLYAGCPATQDCLKKPPQYSARRKQTESGTPQSADK